MARCLLSNSEEQSTYIQMALFVSSQSHFMAPLCVTSKGKLVRQQYLSDPSELVMLSHSACSLLAYSVIARRTPTPLVPIRLERYCSTVGRSTRRVALCSSAWQFRKYLTSSSSSWRFSVLIVSSRC